MKQSRVKQFFLESAGELKNVRSLTLASLLTALYAVTYSFMGGNIMIVPGLVEVRLGIVVVAVAGMLFGPVMGLLVAVLGDFIGALVFYGGSFIVGYTLVWAVMGFGFGCILYRRRVSVPRLCWATVFYVAVIRQVLTTLVLYVTGMGPFRELFLSRVPLNVALLFVNFALLYVVLRAVNGVYGRMLRAPAVK